MKKINKKGSLVDLFYFVIVLAFFSVAILIGTKIAADFHTGISSNPTFQNDAPDAITYTGELVDNYTFSINSAFLFLTVFFIIATLALAALVRIHPIFIPLFLLGLIFLIFFCGIMSNIYATVAESEPMNEVGSSITDRYIIMHNIMIALPFIVGIIGIVLMIVMYKNYAIG